MTDEAPVTGRPTIFTAELITLICNEVASGRSLRSICEDTGMPGQTTIFRWLADNKDFREQYARAREAQMDAMAEEIIDIADTPLIGAKTKTTPDGKTETTTGDMIEHRRLQVETRKWLMSKMAPKRYGDKQQMQLTGADGEDGMPTAIQVTIVDPKR